MGDLLIRNIPDALKADLQKLADKKGQSLSKAAQEALRAGLAAAAQQHGKTDALPPGDRLREIFAGAFESDAEAEEFRKALDDVRKSDFGRPPPDFE